jgi:murein DD-endopeptidase MepM/ murein hydrolase activator NlpD
MRLARSPERRGRSRFARFRRRRGPAGLAAAAALGLGLTLLARPISEGLEALSGRLPIPVPEAAAMRLERRADAPVRLALVPPAAPPQPLAAPAPIALPPRIIAAQAGDTAASLLARAGVGGDEAQAAIRQLGAVWDPKTLQTGQRAAIFLLGDRLMSLRFALAPGREVVVARDDKGGFVAEQQDRPTHAVPLVGSGTIASSLSQAAADAEIPAGIVGEVIAAFSYDVDFQREIHPDDRFTVLYQRIDDEFGEPAGFGHALYAELVLSGKALALYRFAPANGDPGFFTADGTSVKKALLRTPIDGARITSGFGMRLHPILGYSRMHRGVDFGAPSGTRVYAAGDGTITEIGRAGGYGNYIEITHNKQYATAYAHLSGFARGLHEGSHVHQGDVIGYVGMTGLATGPHLHYEVHFKGEQINPLSVKMAATVRLEGNDLAAFRAARAAADREIAEWRRAGRIARVE